MQVGMVGERGWLFGVGHHVDINELLQDGEWLVITVTNVRFSR